MQKIRLIISGGQTGADQGALDAAIACGVPHGGSIPAGRKTEAGPLSNRYQLEELESDLYPVRTEKNVVDSDATLIISHGPLSGGSALTKAIARRRGKPYLHIDCATTTPEETAALVCRWCRDHRVAILNVAGPRASSDPLIYGKVRQIVSQLLDGQDTDGHT